MTEQQIDAYVQLIEESNSADDILSILPDKSAYGYGKLMQGILNSLKKSQDETVAFKIDLIESYMAENDTLEEEDAKIIFSKTGADNFHILKDVKSMRKGYAEKVSKLLEYSVINGCQFSKPIQSHALRSKTGAQSKTYEIKNMAIDEELRICGCRLPGGYTYIFGASIKRDEGTYTIFLDNRINTENSGVKQDFKKLLDLIDKAKQTGDWSMLDKRVVDSKVCFEQLSQIASLKRKDLDIPEKQFEEKEEVSDKKEKAVDDKIDNKPVRYIRKQDDMSFIYSSLTQSQRSTLSPRFRDTYDFLLGFYIAYGTINIEIKDFENENYLTKLGAHDAIKSGNFLRRKYRKGKLSTLEILLLEDIGIDWDYDQKIKNSRKEESDQIEVLSLEPVQNADYDQQEWDKMISLTREYINNYGTADIPEHYTIDGFKVGKKLKEAIKAYEEGTLSEEEISELQSIKAIPSYDEKIDAAETMIKPSQDIEPEDNDPVDYPNTPAFAPTEAGGDLCGEIKEQIENMSFEELVKVKEFINSMELGQKHR